ncbi:hypothetical protein [Streptomyces sp. KS 21]|uniref:hypothetical protein n=1 Tax=Streptomyces sp. KS 21 TaxID=2485150 RepID=UPI0010631129|nr:hypothetical protein [Streptomyces sp. KS 21]TDU67887.1 hypothetical protein EDD91_7946 [Streptomyces sp. KS 21]
MTPRPEAQPNTAEDLKAAVQVAKSVRDAAVAAAETAFWQRMGELSKSYRGAQKDVAAALNVERDAVYKNVRKYTA